MLQRSLRTAPVGLGAAAFAWGAAEASLFFIVPDVLISWVALKHGWRAALLAVVACVTGAGLGGAAVHAWSAHCPVAAARAVEAVPAVAAGAVARAEAEMRRGWFRAALGGSFRGAPYKVWSAAAPAAGVGLGPWTAAAGPVRAPRFLIIGLLFSSLGVVLRPRLRPRFLLGLLFAGGWSAFYLGFWAMAPG